MWVISFESYSMNWIWWNFNWAEFQWINGNFSFVVSSIFPSVFPIFISSSPNQGSAKFLATRSDFENLFWFSQKKILRKRFSSEKDHPDWNMVKIIGGNKDGFGPNLKIFKNCLCHRDQPKNRVGVPISFFQKYAFF